MFSSFGDPPSMSVTKIIGVGKDVYEGLTNLTSKVTEDDILLQKIGITAAIRNRERDLLRKADPAFFAETETARLNKGYATTVENFKKNRAEYVAQGYTQEEANKIAGNIALLETGVNMKSSGGNSL